MGPKTGSMHGENEEFGQGACTIDCSSSRVGTRQSPDPRDLRTSSIHEAVFPAQGVPARLFPVATHHV